MPEYIVTRKERWLQKVHVEACDENEARQFAAKGCGTIWEDPIYDDDIEINTWKVESVDDE